LWLSPGSIHLALQFLNRCLFDEAKLTSDVDVAVSTSVDEGYNVVVTVKVLVASPTYDQQKEESPQTEYASASMFKSGLPHPPATMPITKKTSVINDAINIILQKNDYPEPAQQQRVTDAGCIASREILNTQLHGIYFSVRPWQIQASSTHRERWDSSLL
jgi:hypothetical protein